VTISREGKLLIAHPNLPNTNWFARTVIYVYLDNNTAGTKGIIINMPSVLTVMDLCADQNILYPYSDEKVFQGGPVAGFAVVMLHSSEWQSRNTTTAGPRYLLSSDYDMFEKIAEGNQPAYHRVFAGIASWAPGQLDLELAGDFPFTPCNSWLIADANDNILFEYEGYEQWEQAIDLCSQQMFDNFL
jgi:putative AlgH/UPF0301 family transcriptional regulator